MRKIYIPIGVTCDVTSFLRSIGLRKEALPFDWVVCNVDRITQAIETYFEFFLTDNLFFDPKQQSYMDVPIKKRMWKVWCRRSGILFRHDFDSEQTEYSEVYEKYRRRIRRFVDICSGGDKVIFLTDWDASSYTINTGFLESQNILENVTPNHEELVRQVERFVQSISKSTRI